MTPLDWAEESEHTEIAQLLSVRMLSAASVQQQQQSVPEPVHPDEPSSEHVDPQEQVEPEQAEEITPQQATKEVRNSML